METNEKSIGESTNEYLPVKEGDINAKQYWDSRFNIDWEQKQGREQTRYFASLACSMFPEWFVRDVQIKGYAMCDIGCAEGDALDIFSKIFFSSSLSGEDFSEIAIEKAKKNYPKFSFYTTDILDQSDAKQYDMIYCSNVLEHFKNPRNVLSRLIDRSTNYTIVLIPFREDFKVDEHDVVFDTCDIPLFQNGSQLVYAQSVVCGSKYYMREQLLLIYSKDPDIRKLSNLKDLVEKVCNKDHSQTQKDWQRLNDELYRVNKEKKDHSQTQKDWQRLNDELYRVNKEKKEFENERQYLNTVKKELGESSDEINRLQKLITELQLSHDSITEVKGILTSLQSANTYKWSLYARRVKDQLIKGSWAEKKDFLKYTLRKLRLCKRPCKDLSSFDLLVSAKQSLDNVKITETALKPQKTSGQKDGAQVFIFAGIPYYDIGAGQRCSQMAKTFSRMGYRVYYYYAFDSSESVKFDVYIPALVHKFIDDTSVEEILGLVKKDSVFIFEAPSVKFMPFFEKANQLGIKTIYEHIDNWETSLGSLLYDPQSFRYFIDHSAYLVATSAELVKQLQSYVDGDVVYVPNAVDVDLFEPNYKRERPSDLVSGREKTLLYFGSLWGEWFDWDLVRSVAHACPESVFNMIGDHSGISHIIKTLPKNVVFLGLKKQTELPAYLAYSDIAMLPFKNCDIGRYVSPLKIFEYIAMNKKVLATPLPDILDYPNTVCSENAQDWISVINGNIATENAASFTGNNNWYSRCNALLDMCGVNLYSGTEYSVSIIVLNRNNMSVIFRCVDSLIKHSRRYHCEIVVVDNCSSDGSYEKLREAYHDQITLVRNEKNGCACGRNLGVEHSHGDILVFLDSDQWVVDDRWLDCALYLISMYPGIGALSWGAGWFTPGKVTGNIVDYYPNRAIRPDQFYREDLAYLATSGFVMKKSVFDCTEGFDTAYDPTCFEDTDLSFQVSALGLKTVYCPLMGIMHLSHQTTKSGEASHQKLIQKNGEYFVQKWTEKNLALLQKAWSYYPG